MVDTARITRYLLGELSEEELDAVDAEFFKDEDAFQALTAAEDELFEAYAADELSAPRRERFEQRFLASPAGRQRLELTRALSRWAAGPRPGSRAEPLPLPRRRLAGLAAAAALVAGMGWLFAQWMLLRGDLARLGAEQAAGSQRERESQRLVSDLQLRVDRLVEQLAHERTPVESSEAPSAMARAVALVLKPGLLRDFDRPQSLTLPPGTDWARLELVLRRNEHPRYSVRLETAEGGVLWEQGGLEARSSSAGTVVPVSFQAGLLAEGHYILGLRGVGSHGRSEVVEEYSFRVQKSR